MKVWHSPNSRGLLLVLSLCASVALPSAVRAEMHDSYNYKPDGGYIGASNIAVPIAEIVLKSIYGEKTIDNEKPLLAKLTSDGVWIVSGSFKEHPGAVKKGGVAEIWISKSDGRILKVTHGE